MLLARAVQESCPVGQAVKEPPFCCLIVASKLLIRYYIAPSLCFDHLGDKRIPRELGQVRALERPGFSGVKELFIAIIDLAEDPALLPFAG
jgi:hypothetical protein